MATDEAPPPGVELKWQGPGDAIPHQKLVADCNEIAMAFFQDQVRDGRLGWSFEDRREAEREIESRITKQLFGGDGERSPRIRLIRDKKTGLVSLELIARREPHWNERLKGKGS